jgi:O-antigen/teichoic acid export membrane protein
MNSRDAAPPPAGPRAPLFREIASHAGITLLSTLAIQVTTFGILALAALILPIEEFARLSLIVAAVMLANALFEMGLNITATKMYGETREEEYLRLGLAVRLWLIPVGVALGTVIALAGSVDAGVGVGLGSLLNVWNGIRATDQARHDYRSFSRSSLIFVGLRAAAGLSMLIIWRDPIGIAIAMYAVPVAASASSVSAKYLMAGSLIPKVTISKWISYAGYVYITSIAYIGTSYLPQFFISSRLDAVAAATYGLIITFSGVVPLLVYSLRSALLPKLFGPESSFEDALWSRRGLLAATGVWIALLAGGGALGACLEAFYGERFPDIKLAFWIFFFGVASSAVAGIFHLSVHTQSVPKLAMKVTLVRILSLAALLYLLDGSIIFVVTSIAVVMVASDIALAAMLARRRAMVVA